MSRPGFPESCRTLKAKRGGLTRRRWRQLIRNYQTLMSAARLDHEQRSTCADWDWRATRTFRGWRHPQAVGR
jgi:hypothetical protein